MTIISLQSPQQQPTQPAPQQQPTQSLQLPESAGARETAQSVAPARKRQGRRCGRCLSHGGGDPLACPGRGGARYCTHFDDTGGLRRTHKARKEN